MGTDFILPLCQIGALALGGVTALYYALNNPATRMRNTLMSLVLLSLACYRFLGAS